MFLKKSIFTLIVKGLGVVALLALSTLCIKFGYFNYWTTFVLVFTLANMLSILQRFGLDTFTMVKISKGLRKEPILWSAIKGTTINFALILPIILLVTYFYKDYGVIFLSILFISIPLISLYSVILESKRAEGAVYHYLFFNNVAPYILPLVCLALFYFFVDNLASIPESILFLLFVFFIAVYLFFSRKVISGSSRERVEPLEGTSWKELLSYFLVSFVPFITDWGTNLFVENIYSTEMFARYSFDMRVASVQKMLVVAVVSAYIPELVSKIGDKKRFFYALKRQVAFIAVLLLASFVICVILFSYYNAILTLENYQASHFLVILLSQSISALSLFFIFASVSIAENANNLINTQLLKCILVFVGFMILSWSMSLSYECYLFVFIIINVSILIFSITPIKKYLKGN